MKSMCFLFCLVLSLTGNAQNNALDPLFGSNGIVTLDTGACGKIVVQPDGRMLITGGENYQGKYTTLMRLNSDGSVDDSFANNGHFQIEQSYDTFLYSTVLLPDGKIVLGGDGKNAAGVYTSYFVRLKPDGSYDSTFGTNGKSATPYVPNNAITWLNPGDGTEFMARQPDGKLIGAGEISYAPACYSLVRVDSNGNIDTSFGHTGKVFYTPPNNNVYGGDINGLVVGPDGKIWLGATNYGGGLNGCVLYKFNADGSPDTSFNHTGLVYNPLGGLVYCSGILLQPDGKLLQAGYNDSAFVFRMDAAGTLDTGFGYGGVCRIAPGVVRSMVLRADGKIMIGGSINDTVFAAWRCNSNGTVDTGFGTAGCITTTIGNRDNRGGYGMALQPDGKLLLGGSYEPNPYPDNIVKFALVRYGADAGAGIATLPAGTGNIKVYPNPASQCIYIANNSGRQLTAVLVYNMSGQVVYHATENISVIPTAGWPAGNYALQVNMAGGAGNSSMIQVQH